MEMNRRQFCALGTAGALAAIAGGVSLGCSSEGASKDAPAAAAAMAIGDADVNFSQEVDVLIVGAGISGMLASIDPAAAGKKVAHRGAELHVRRRRHLLGGLPDVHHGRAHQRGAPG